MFSIIIPYEFLSQFGLKIKYNGKLVRKLKPKWLYLSHGAIFLMTIAAASACNSFAKSAEVNKTLLLL